MLKTDLFTTASHVTQLREDMEQAWQLTEDFLRRESQKSHWTGNLSTSALSTATAVSAIALCRQHQVLPEHYVALADEAISSGCRWLAQHQNADGGFGDTDRSYSNIATSLLVAAAWKLAGFAPTGNQGETANAYIESTGKWDALRRRYGKDKTFVVPILTNCALAGLAEWKSVPPLPFEAAWLPQSWYRLARMPVVSYAVPALVAMGQAKFHFHPPRNPLIALARKQAIAPTLRVLRKMQPDSGGYLEAVPLTSFVLMSLAAVGRGNLPVAQDALRFLFDSRLADGSWPIDTNLATWLTSLSILAISRREQSLLRISAVTALAEKQCAAPNVEDGPRAQMPRTVATELTTELGSSDLVTAQTLRWLLDCQHRRRHPFTGANPGGWGWTDLSGAVPDADDTPAALLALASVDLSAPQLTRLKQQTDQAVSSGLRWLCELQNRDGGWPTFCRGWGKLPFDRSGTDLTAHALRAFQAWLPALTELQEKFPATPTEAKIRWSMDRGLAYIARKQRSDGSWIPLWFGNQDDSAEDNPIYGTSKVLLAFADLQRCEAAAAQAGINYLIQAQNADGGWGGGPGVSYIGSSSTESSSLEESALALEALLQCGGVTLCTPTIMRALAWLTTTIKHGNLERSTPIGFYFAKLWYYERLYPAIFCHAALSVGLRYFDGTEATYSG